MKEKVIDFGNERVSVLFKKLFFPTLLGMLSMSAVTTIDGIFVGHGVGSDGIAAVNICVPLLMSLMGVGLMMGAGCSVIASIYLSKGKTVLARATITQAMLFVTLISVTVGGFILAFPEETARMLGSSEHLLPLVVDYLSWFPVSAVRVVDCRRLVCHAPGRRSETRHVVQHHSRSGECRSRLAVHLPAGLGSDGGGICYLPELFGRGSGGDGLLVVLCP